MLKETREEKQKRIFEFYKKDLEKLGKEHKKIRMICIEYTCHFPKIDPFKMAAALSHDGHKILFDDSSISAEENKRKERKLEKLLKTA